MLKRILTIIALLVVITKRGLTEPQIPAPAGAPSGVIALTTGAAVRLVPNQSTAAPIKCNSVFIQSLAGNAALVFVLNAPPNIVMAKDGQGTTNVAQLGIGTATAPGQSFTFPSNSTATSGSGGFDLRYFGVQGTTGDSVYASCDLRQ